MRPLAVNLDGCESDLEVARPHELDVALGDLPHEYVAGAEAFLQDEEQARREVWPTILLALVAVLMLEQGLAWWFGTPGHARRVGTGAQTGRGIRGWGALFFRGTAGAGPGRYRSVGRAK